MMGSSNTVDWLLTVGAISVCVLQWATFALAREQPILRAGRALVLLGWTLAAARMSYLIATTGDLPMPGVTQLWIGLLEAGLFLSALHHILQASEAEAA